MCETSPVSPKLSVLRTSMSFTNLTVLTITRRNMIETALTCRLYIRLCIGQGSIRPMFYSNTSSTVTAIAADNK